MVKEGYWFGLPLLVIGGVSLSFGSALGITIGAVLVFLALFVFYFFRNPDRKIPAGLKCRARF